jgi:hypothetical protein
MNVQGNGKQVAELEEKIIKLAKELEELPNTFEDFGRLFGGLFGLEELDLLDKLENYNTEEDINLWLANVLVRSGRYVHAGKGFVDIKRDDAVDQTTE